MIAIDYRRNLNHPTELGAPWPGPPRAGLRPWGGYLDFQTWDTAKSRRPSLDPSQIQSAPSIRRVAAATEWVGNHKSLRPVLRENAR